MSNDGRKGCPVCTPFQGMLDEKPRYLCTHRPGCRNDEAPPPPPVEPERYCLGLLAGEMGEAQDVIGMVLRFGADTPSGLGTSARDHLTRELGDVLAAIRFAARHGLIDLAAVDDFAARKLRKLLDPDATDNLGRRLAPAPTEGGPTP